MPPDFTLTYFSDLSEKFDLLIKCLVCHEMLNMFEKCRICWKMSEDVGNLVSENVGFVQKCWQMSEVVER